MSNYFNIPYLEKKKQAIYLKKNMTKNPSIDKAYKKNHLVIEIPND